jgi:hypothetical protein
LQQLPVTALALLQPSNDYLKPNLAADQLPSLRGLTGTQCGMIISLNPSALPFYPRELTPRILRGTASAAAQHRKLQLGGVQITKYNC